MKTRFNNSFATFYTKHVIGCCGVRHHLHNIDENVINVCPCCEEPDETTSHILLCEDKDRTTLYKKSVQGLMNWMVKQGTLPQITKMVGDYLRARNTKTMMEIYDGPKTDDLRGIGWKLAQEHDQLGWQNFAEGRISKLYIDIQNRWYKRETTKKCRKTVETWATGFIENLIRITHNQWTWRNEKLHFRQHPGAETVFEYETTMQRILDDLEMMSPEDLLPEDQYLLGVDPEDLAASSKVKRQVWQAELETAVAAAEHATIRLNSPPECKHEDVQAAHFKPSKLGDVYMRLDVVGTKPKRRDRS